MVPKQLLDCSFIPLELDKYMEMASQCIVLDKYMEMTSLPWDPSLETITLGSLSGNNNKSLPLESSETITMGSLPGDPSLGTVTRPLPRRRSTQYVGVGGRR